MTADTRQRARLILAAALDEPSDTRHAYVAARCGNDDALRGEVELLLGTDAPAHHEPPPLASTRIDDTTRPLGAPATGADDSDVETWGDFVILHEVGRGGFGVVYRAWDRTLERDLALKIINVARLPRSRGDILVREGQMLARVRHHNVVQVYGVQRRGPEVGLVMEYIRGRTLAAVVAQSGPIAAQEAAAIGVTLCDALAHVHRMGFVHRDVKAANVMREQGGRIVLMDFGAGHELVPYGEPASVIAGTPVYMSPEVQAGMAASPASDIYSLGVLLFHLVTGSYPSARRELEHDAECRPKGCIAAELQAARSGLPATFAEAVDAALALERQRRPTPAALRKTLDAVTGTSRRKHPARRPVTDATSPPPQPPSRAPLVTAAATLSAVVLLCTLVGFVTTLEYNYVLDRSGEFAAESLMAHPYWGARVLLPSVIYAVAALLVVNAIALLARLLGVAVPALGRVWRQLATRVSDRLRNAGMGEPKTACQTLCVLCAAALCAILAVSAPSLAGLAENISTGDTTALATLTKDYRPAHQLFRVSLSLLLAVLVHGAMRLRRSDGRGSRSSSVAGVQMATLIALTGIILLMLAVPWRVIREPEFREASLNGNPCFVLGAHGTELLVHCPGLPTPRNRVLSASDPRLVVHDRRSDLFTAYAAGEASAPTSTR